MNVVEICMSKNKTEEDASELVHHDELAQEREPELPPLRDEYDPQTTNEHRDNGAVSLGQVNPSLDDRDDDAVEQTRSATTGVKNGSVETEVKSQTHQAEGEESRDITLSSPPVYYSSQAGETNVVHEPVVIRQANGIHVIRTRQCCHHQQGINPRERPLKLKHIKLLKGFSILAIILFFPLGFMAMYCAFKSEKEFHAGIMRGDIDLARKYAKRSERFIIFSVLGALLVAVMVFAFVERKLMADDEEYWKNRSNAHFVPAG